MRTARPGITSSATLSDDEHRLLIVNSHFPTNGGTRVEKFVKLLPRFGIRPVVLSARECTPQHAGSLVSELHPGPLEHHQARSLGWSYFTDRYLDRGPGRKYYTLLKWLSLPERSIFFPDHMVRWIPDGIFRARRIVKTLGIKTVLTSSPPASTHLIGLYLKQKLGLHWIADFRDLWTESPMLYRPATALHDHWTRNLERHIFERADHVIANTPDNLDHYIKRFHLPRHRISLIPNGFDREDLPASVEKSRDVFLIGHMGSFDKQSYPWRSFLDALKLLANHAGPGRVKFVHCGFYSREVDEYIKTNSMEELVTNHGMLPHRDAVRVVAGTNLRLVLLGEDNGSSATAPPKVPAKLYNYLIMDGPVLAVAPENSDISGILSETRMGSVISPKQGVQGIFGVLHDYFIRWEKNTLRVDPSRENIARYDRLIQTGNLVKILSALESN